MFDFNNLKPKLTLLSKNVIKWSENIKEMTPLFDIFDCLLVYMWSIRVPLQLFLISCDKPKLLMSRIHDMALYLIQINVEVPNDNEFFSRECVDFLQKSVTSCGGIYTVKAWNVSAFLWLNFKKLCTKFISVSSFSAKCQFHRYVYYDSPSTLLSISSIVIIAFDWDFKVSYRWVRPWLSYW